MNVIKNKEMNSKFYVSLEAARLLKDKGYNEECNYYFVENENRIIYVSDNVINADFAEWRRKAYTAPSKAEAIDYLDSKGIVVELSYDDQAHMDNARWEYFIYTHDNDGWVEAMVCSWVEDNYYKTRLEAEEAAIIKALELLKVKEE